MADITPVTDEVRRKYGEIATRVREGGTDSCCGPAACGCGDDHPITGGLYGGEDLGALPPEAVTASLGCGNPTALAELRPGEVVLDLGSGGGIDVLLSARRVGADGFAYGLDMTDEMLALARQNQQQAGVTNVEFIKGSIEQIPLPDDSVDVIISNCVINLSADKDRVFAEARRVLKPGGRFAVSDVVRRRAVRPELQRSIELWVGCVAGALEEGDYVARLERAGFVGASIEPTRIYQATDAAQFLAEAGFDPEQVGAEVDGAFMSAFVRASAPVS